MAPAVLLPAALVVLAAELLFLAEADGVQSVGGNAQRDEVLLDGARAAIAKREVVFGGTALVTMTFNGDAHLRIIAQEFGGLPEGFASIGANVPLIEVKIGIAHFLEEEFIQVRSGRRCRRRRSFDRDTRCGRRRTTRTAGGDGVLGGIGRRNFCRSLSVYGTHFRSDG